jgi:multidrug efflux pump subunit AcrB
MAEALYAATEGLEAARLEINGRPLEVRVAGRLPRESEIQPMSPASPEGFLADLPIVLPGGGAVSLGSIAEIERTDAPASLARLDRSDVLYLELDPRLDSSEDGLSALVRTIETTVGGISPANQSTFVRYRKALILTVAVVVLLLYLCLGAQFESFSLPLVLLAAIPFSIAGAGPALAVLGCGLDSGAVLGLVVLFGLAVNHGITVYEESSAGCGRGLLVLHSVYRATANRFRSIVATTMTTLLALLPVVASPLGASQRSMAAAMLGGIGACALLTLFVFPPLLVSFLQKGERL